MAMISYLIRRVRVTFTTDFSWRKFMLPQCTRRYLCSSHRPFSWSWSTSRCAHQMATKESLEADITRASARFTDLRKQNAEPALVEEARIKLGELRKSLALLNGAGGGKAADKRKDRMLLKTAKVRQLYVLGHHYRTSMLRERAIGDQRRCSADST
jgi:hypothetical protein